MKLARHVETDMEGQAGSEDGIRAHNRLYAEIDWAQWTISIRQAEWEGYT